MSGVSLKVKIFGTHGTQIVPVSKSNLTVGSAKHCDVVLDHPSVQEEHLRAWFDAGRIWIQDMGTTSGTFLNGIRLPSLKPMLVRELDVLKLGDNPVTLGMEANLVRAPIVRPQAPIDEVTQPGIKVSAPAKDVDLEKKRDELAKVRRELAELKLQLQMGRLDKDSEDEAHRHLSLVRNEMQALQDQRAKLERNLKQMEQQRQSQLEALEKELVERKANSMNQLKNLMDHEMSKLAEWKMQVMGEIRRDIHSISQAKAKSWITRPLSNDMILEWESDIQNLLRRVILGEKVDSEPLPVTPAEEKNDVPPLPDKKSKSHVDENSQAAYRVSAGHGPGKTRTNITGGGTHSYTHTPVPRMKRRVQIGKTQADTVKLALMFIFAGGLIAAAVMFKKGIFPIKERNVAGSVDGSSTQSPKAPQRKKFEPSLSKNFKKNYTDNVLYTQEFIDSELNSNYRNLWLIDLNKAALNDWKIDMNTAKLVAEREYNLLLDLKRLRDNIDGNAEAAGIQAMREREAAFNMELNTLLKSRPLTDRFSKLKRTFFTRMQAAAQKSSAKK